MITYESVKEASDAVLDRVGGEQPEVALVLGSGLGGLADELEDARAIPYAEIPGFAEATVSGHAGRLVVGRLAGKRVVVLQGRLHLYEGHSAGRVAFPVRVVGMMGATRLILTNAAGGIHPDFRPGDVVRIVDHINLSGETPLTGPNDERLGPRFPDMSAAYDPALGALFDRVAAELGERVHRGVYAFLRGPSYETPAEIRMLRTLGADLVGMSTVPETIVAVHMGLSVLGISLVANAAAGLSPHRLSHEEVERTARASGERLARLLRAFIERL